MCVQLITLLFNTPQLILMASKISLNAKLLSKEQGDHHYHSESSKKHLSQLQELMIKQDHQNSDGEEEQLKQQIYRIDKQIKEKKLDRKRKEKVFVGTGFGLDISEFFKFKKKKELSSSGGNDNIFEDFVGTHMAWTILFYLVINSAMIPSWTMHIQATKYLRISWRFLLQSLMIIPFMLYERRNATETIREKYQLGYIFRLQNLKIAYLSSFATSFYFTVLLMTFQWTYVSHAILLASLSNFFLSIKRTSKKSGHEMEPGGQLLITTGIIMVIIDSYTLKPEEFPPQFENQYLNTKFLHRTLPQRIAADLTAVGVGFAMSKFSVLTAELKSYYPPFLGMFLANFFICINMTFSAYFFNGATFDFEPHFGVFSIFSQKHFAGFLYMSIILCMGLIISSMMISKMFPTPVVPSLAMTLEPCISTVFIQVTGVQEMPGGFALIGYAFIIPGNILILIGQWLFQNSQKKQREEQKKRITELFELRSSLKEKISAVQLKQVSGKKKELRKVNYKPESSHYDQKYQINNELKTFTELDISHDERQVSQDFRCDMNKNIQFRKVGDISSASLH